MDGSLKMLFSFVAAILTFIAFLPYLISIMKGQTRPHVFSWVIWGITTLIVFFAQQQSAAGWGAWPIGLSALITLLVAFAAFCKRADTHITRLDWGFFVAALAALPFWYWMNDPMWAVILLTCVDLLGFVPTIRKAYAFPLQESLTFFVLFVLRNTFVLLALEEYSIATALFPSAINLACLVLLCTVLYRRQQLGTIKG